MKSAYRDTCAGVTNGDKTLRPSVQTYSCVLWALANDRKARNDRRSWLLLDRMRAIGMRPNTFTYNYVINIASYHVPSPSPAAPSVIQQKVATFWIALAAFRSLRAAKGPVGGPDSLRTRIF